MLSVKKQSHLPNEVIIADDGSREDTKELIQKFQQKFPVPLHHIWHKDNKNQKPAIMNKAIASSKYDYIIEIDGDIIMHKDFVKDHLSLSEEKVYLYGSRVNIQENYLETLFKKKQIDFKFLDFEVSITELIQSAVLDRFIIPESDRVISFTLCPLYNA